MRVLTATLLASAALIAISHRAGAEDALDDTEIRVVAYSPLKRTEVIGVVGQPTTFTFPKGESIYRVVQSGKPDKDGTMARIPEQTVGQVGGRAHSRVRMRSQLSVASA